MASEEKATTAPAILIESLRVDYGKVQAVSDLSLEIQIGEVFGLIGPNGAGKSSTIEVLAGLLKPTYGKVFVSGIDIVEEPEKVRPTLGYMPDLAPVYERLTITEFLMLFAGAYRLPKARRLARIAECIELVQLASKADVLCHELSRGMQQRLVLAKTLIPDPDILLLDEPASGLDPHARIELRDTIRNLAGAGKTVLISSHILTEMSEFCTSVGIMERGKMVVYGSLEDVISQFSEGKTIHVIVLDRVEAAMKLLQAQEGVSKLKKQGNSIAFSFVGDDNAMANLLLALTRVCLVQSFCEQEMNVEDIFMQVGARAVS